jgi:hypothetical protein
LQISVAARTCTCGLLALHEYRVLAKPKMFEWKIHPLDDLTWDISQPISTALFSDGDDYCEDAKPFELHRPSDGDLV